jgi:beta-mannosidase
MKVDLNGNWLMKKSTDDKFISSIVPGSVYADLMREGIMGDPFWRDNEKEAVEFSQFDYTYMRTFLVSDEFFKNEYIELICDGIDTDGVHSKPKENTGITSIILQMRGAEV